jgi:hypothetical protein
MPSELRMRPRQFSAPPGSSRVDVPRQPVVLTLKLKQPSLSVPGSTFPSMNVDVWLPPVLAAVIGAPLSLSVGKGLLMLALELAGSSMSRLTVPSCTPTACRWMKTSSGLPSPPTKLS